MPQPSIAGYIQLIVDIWEFISSEINQLTKILADDDFCDPDKNEIYSIWGKDAPSIFNATDVVQFPP